MSFTYDFTTAPTISTVRLMVGDTDPTPPGPFFQDAEVQAALNLNFSQNIIVNLAGYVPQVPPPITYSYGRAAALLLNSLSAVRARNLVTKVLDVTLDGKSAAAALQALGKQYIEQENTAGYFAVSELVQDAFSMRDRLWKMLYRIQN